MANFTDRIKLVFDVDKNAGTAALKNFGNDFRNAEGFANKFKVAGGGALEFVKGHAVQLAAVGGAALVGFAVKALGAFEDVAKAAKDMGTATGLSTEEASRWIAVADDFEVSGETITKALTSVVKSLDASKWDKYGISTKTASGELRSTNDLLIDGLTRLSRIDNATERAAAGNALFGKSYKDLSPLIGHTRAEYEKMLGSVEKGQVITDAESAKAERMRLAQDAFADALNEVTLAVGQQVAKLVPYLELITKIVQKAEDIGDLAIPLPDLDGGGSFREALDNITKKAIESGDALGYLVAQGSTVDQATERIALYQEKLDAAAAVTEAARQTTIGYTTARIAASHAEQQGAEYTGKSVAEWVAGIPVLGAVVAVMGDWIDKANEGRVTTDGASVVQSRFNDVMNRFRGILGDIRDGYHVTESAATKFAAALRDVAAEQKHAEEAASDLNDALTEQHDALEKLRGDALSDIDAKYALEEAIAASEDALREYNETVADGESTADDRADAERAFGDAARATAEAYAKSTGAADGSKASIDAQVKSLYIQASVLADGSPLRSRLLGYITDLTGIPATVPTKITVDTEDAIRRLHEVNRLIDLLNARHSVTPPAPGARSFTGQGFGDASQGFSGRGASGNGFGPPGSQGDAGDFIAGGQAGVWVAAVDEETDAVEQSVEDQKRALDELMARKLEQGAITLAAYLQYLDEQNAAEIAAGNQYSDRQHSLYMLSRQIRDQQTQDARQAAEDAALAAQEAADAAIAAEDRKQKWLYDNHLISAEEYKAYLAARYGDDAAYSDGWYALQDGIKAVNADVAAAFAAAEKVKQDAIDATIAKLKEEAALLDDKAQALADLEVAAQKQLAAEERLKLLQIAAQQPGEYGDAARAQLAQAEADLAAATLAGAEARARAEGLTPGTAAYNAFVQQQVADYIAQHQSLGGGALFDLAELVKKIPSADDYATAMANAMTTIVVPALVAALRGVTVTVGAQQVAGITAEQQRQAGGAS